MSNAITIELHETDPLLRLREFCNLCTFFHQFTITQFQNGIMTECEVYYFRGSDRYTLKKEAYFLRDCDVHTAKKTICAILLENIGLGVPRNTDEEDLEQTHELLTRVGMRAINDILSSVKEN